MFISYVQKVLVPIVAWYRAFEISVDPFDGLCCLDQWDFFGLIISGIRFNTDLVLTRKKFQIVKRARQALSVYKLVYPGYIPLAEWLVKLVKSMLRC